MEKTMRILMTPGIFPPESGGPATFIPHLAEQLVDRGHEIEVVTNGESAPEIDAQFPFEVTRVSCNRPAPLRYGSQVMEIIRTIRRFNPDIVFTNAFGWQSLIAARLTGRPLVSKIVGDMAWQRYRTQGAIDDGIETFVEETYTPWIEAVKKVRTWEAKGSHTIVVPSEYLRELVSSWGVSPDHITVIHNSIRAREDVPGVKSRDPYIVTVGRLVDWKGMRGVIDAMSLIAERHSDAELHVIGTGPERASLESYAAERLPTNAYKFHGRVPHETVLDLVSESRVFVLNSTYEGLPHVVLEALTCGTPAVVSDAGGNPEVINEDTGGRVVQQGDVRAIASACTEFIEDDDAWQRAHREGRQRVKDVFDPDDMVDNYERLLRSVVEEHRAVARTNP